MGGLLISSCPTPTPTVLTLPPSKHIHITDFPNELISFILCFADLQTLHHLSLVSHLFLQISRPLLFADLAFDEPEDICVITRLSNPRYGINDRRFDTFLDLLESPWNSIARCVRGIQFAHIFLEGRRHQYKNRRDVRGFAEKLCGIIYLKMSRMSWVMIPPHLKEFFLAVPAKQIHFESVGFEEAASFVELFKSPLMTTAFQHLSMYNIDVKHTSSLIDHIGSFKRGFHVHAIDLHSLINFHQVWDSPTTMAQISVRSLHLEFGPLFLPRIQKPHPVPRDELNDPAPRIELDSKLLRLILFIKSFLTHVGPRINALCIYLTTPEHRPQDSGTPMT
ncbi:hypothetical protein H0H87_010351 [Tephrocybe sp. NHM501043]|nr:hypothetical protein H0H87_010351 [Tephrocybe sp. NHM501043]